MNNTFQKPCFKRSSSIYQVHIYIDYKGLTNNAIMCNVSPNYAYMGYSENCLAESLFSNATSSPAVALFMALWFCCQEVADFLFLTKRERLCQFFPTDNKRKKQKCVCNCEQHTGLLTPWDKGCQQ